MRHEVALAFALGLSGCYDGTPGRPVDPLAFDEPSSTGFTSHGTSTGSDSAPDAGSSTGAEQWVEQPARGIRVTAISANQGIATTLARGSVVTPPSGEARLVAARPTLIVAELQTEVDFEPREIIGRLRITYADGKTGTRELNRVITRGSDPLLPDTGFDWQLSPGELRPGMSIAVELLELVPDGNANAAPNRFPANGSIELEVAPNDHTLRMVLVPYRNVDGACDQTAPHDAALVDAFRTAALEHLPVRDVELEVHPVVTFNGSMAELGDALDHLFDLRLAEQPAPDVYYYGLLYPCAAQTSAGGIAYLPGSPGSVSEADFRVGVGKWYGHTPNVAWATVRTFIHELGHNLGRMHVACAGDEAKGGSVEPNYPHAGGKINRLGWAHVAGRFVHPQQPDIMSYCLNAAGWQSDFGWNAAVGVFAQLSAESAAAPPASEESVLLVVRRDATGQVHARAVRGAARPGVTVPLRAITDDGALRLYGRRAEIADGSGGEIIVAPLAPSVLRSVRGFVTDEGREIRLEETDGLEPWIRGAR